MFLRLLILESDKNSLWIKIVGAALITLRLADWPYELASLPTVHSAPDISTSVSGSTCWATWANGVIILNFIGDALANLFLSGMFVRRLYVHIRKSKMVISHHNCLIEYIARKSLVCLALTFVVNLTMNLLKVTMFLGDRSDAFTVYFAIIESSLLVEALRVDYPGLRNTSTCQQCVHSSYTDLGGRNHTKTKRKKKKDDDDGDDDDGDDYNVDIEHNGNGDIQLGDDDDDNDLRKDNVQQLHPRPSQHITFEMMPTRATTSLPKSFKFVNQNLHSLYSPTSSYQQQASLTPHQMKSLHTVQQTASAPPFTGFIQPVVRSSGEIKATPTMSLASVELTPMWSPSRQSNKLD
ncbi:hypothetical protein BC941DRAFT_265913 [Chlamydoabsidia padenii]|nr:hypothetical protein BC941DRAFT_265913 [Chlamydoabsidia padenii]